MLTSQAATITSLETEVGEHKMTIQSMSANMDALSGPCKKIPLSNQ